MADDALPRVKAPTLLIVGGDDEEVIDLNRQAMEQMRAYANWNGVQPPVGRPLDDGAYEAVGDRPGRVMLRVSVTADFHLLPGK